MTINQISETMRLEAIGTVSYLKAALANSKSPKVVTLLQPLRQLENFIESIQSQPLSPPSEDLKLEAIASVEAFKATLTNYSGSKVAILLQRLNNLEQFIKDTTFKYLLGHPLEGLLELGENKSFLKTKVYNPYIERVSEISPPPPPKSFRNPCPVRITA